MLLILTYNYRVILHQEVAMLENTNDKFYWTMNFSG